MCKSRFLAIFFGMLLVLSNTSEARVCFLSGSDAFNCSSGTYDDYIKVSKCSGYELCQYPSKNPGKTCEEEDMTHYLPEDCCSNTSLYENCPSPKECEGRKCETRIRGPMAYGKPVQWRDATFCEIGKCHCPATYKELCDGNGQEGAFLDGTPDEEGCVGDDGVTRYEACICGDEYAVCDPEAKPSTDEDDICTDSNDVTKYRQCTCDPATAKRPEGGNWVADPSNCCEGAVKTCKGHNASDAYYCRPVSAPMGLCGYTMDGACYGADRSYDYITSSVTEYVSVQCDDKWTYSNRYCGINCTCATGYFDFATECAEKRLERDYCKDIGYTDKSCPGDFVACPYDKTTKKCIEAACTYYEESSCENASGKVCTKDANGCWNFTSCSEGYSKTAGKCLPNDCTGFTLTSCPGGAICDPCLSGTTTMYKKTGCEDGYYDKDGTCTSCLDNPVVTTCPEKADQCYEMSNGYCFINCVSGYKRSGSTCEKNSSSTGNVGNPCFGHTGGYVCSQNDKWYSSESGCASVCGGSTKCLKCGTSGNFYDKVDGEIYDDALELYQGGTTRTRNPQCPDTCDFYWLEGQAQCVSKCPSAQGAVVQNCIQCIYTSYGI